MNVALAPHEYRCCLTVRLGSAEVEITPGDRQGNRTIVISLGNSDRIKKKNTANIHCSSVPYY